MVKPAFNQKTLLFVQIRDVKSIRPVLKILKMQMIIL